MSGGRYPKLGNVIIRIVSRLYDFVPIWNVPASLERSVQTVFGQLLEVRDLNILSYILLTLTVGGLYHLMESAEAKRHKIAQN